MGLDYSILPFQVLIGDLDITDYLTSFEIGRPIYEFGTPLTWTGSFNLQWNGDQSLAESTFSHILNPSYFRPYQKECFFYIQGILVCRFYIRRYIYDDTSRTGEGDIYQILDVAIGEGISEELEQPLNEFQTPIGDVIVSLLEQAYNDSSIATPTIVIDKSKHRGTLDDRLTSSDPVSDACDFASKSYYWLYVDTLGRINQISADPTQSTVLIVRSRNECEITPLFDNVNFAADKTIVTGSRKDLSTDFSFGYSVSILDAPENGEDTFTSDGKPLLLVTETYKKKWELVPELCAVQRVEDSTGYVRYEILDDSEILYERKEVRYKYWGVNPPFERIETLVSDPEVDTKYLPQIQDFSAIWEFGELVQTITTTYRVKGDMFPINKGLTSRIFNTELGFYDKVIEVPWARIVYLAKGIVDGQLNFGDYEFTNPDYTPTLVISEPIKNGRVNPDGTIPEKVGDKSTDPDPEKDPKSVFKYEYRPKPEEKQPEPELDLEEVLLKGEANFEPVGWIPFRKKPYTVELGFIADEEQANYLALQLGLREIRRRDAVTVQMPIPMEWLEAGCIPLYKARLHNAEYFVNEEIVSIEEGRMIYAFTGERIGSIDPIPDTPNPTPFLPNQVLYVQNQSTRLIVGESVVKQFAVIGGTPDYTFSVDTLPSGLSLSVGGLLTGIPTSAGVSSSTLTVTDSLSVSVNATISFTIVSNQPAISLDRIVSELKSIVRVDGRSTFVFPTESLIKLTAKAFSQIVTPIRDVVRIRATANESELIAVSVQPGIVEINGGVPTTATDYNTIALPGISEIIGGVPITVVSFAETITTPGIVEIIGGVSTTATDYNTIALPGISEIIGGVPTTVVDSSSGYDADTDALLARFIGSYSTPDTDKIDLVITQLKSYSLWNKLVFLRVYCSPEATDSRLNWKGDYYNATVGGSPSFVANEGYSSNNGAGYLNSNYTPSSESTVFTQDSAAFGIWRLATTAANDLDVEMGAYPVSGTNFAFVRCRPSIGDTTAALNGNEVTESGDTLTPMSGLYSVIRNDSTQIKLRHRGTTYGTLTVSSSGLPTVPFYTCALNYGNSAIQHAKSRIALDYAASGLTDTEESNLYTILANYLAYKGIT